MKNEEQFPRATLRKFGDIIVWESGDPYTWEMHYDLDGNYIGQVQENMLAMDENEPPTLFLKPQYINGKPCVNGKPVEPLSPQQIEKAM